MSKKTKNAEAERLAGSDSYGEDWKNWGCYVSERAWGTVREDYSADGSAWDYFPFEHAHLRTFRWNEDGIAGICDRHQNICFALSFWNEKDPILKERLFGLAGPKGNHGEDVKECYYYLDNTPTHSYMKYLYKYPQTEFPYKRLYDENAARTKEDDEFELIDTGIFDENKYFDIFIEYAKADIDDICIKITAINRANETAPLHILPTVWFRNTWVWDGIEEKPQLSRISARELKIEMSKELHCNYTMFFEDNNELVFCENETNNEKLFASKNLAKFTKDGISEYIVNGNKNAVNAAATGTKAAGVYKADIAAGEAKIIKIRLQKTAKADAAKAFSEFDQIFADRIAEADEFYDGVIPQNLSDDAKNIQRQAFAGMLWCKQYYHYVVKTWLEGDKAFPPPPKERLNGRNSNWPYLYNSDIISMPDKWEYPWYAAWDLAFHCIPLAVIDAGFAKRQLILFLREWYMHPSGQIPAYEWALGDVNPPVHGWAALRVYRIDAAATGKPDRIFLEKVFHKLLLNFTWWVNRKDTEGNNVFEGGFLGLDNIGVFDRNAPLKDGSYIEQSDGTSWMAMYCLNLMSIAIELALFDKAYEDVASKFLEHFVYISDAMNNLGEHNTELWHEQDGFYYDVLHVDGKHIPIQLRSIVGLFPILAVTTLEAEWIDALPNFKRRTEWLLQNREDLTDDISCMQIPGRNGRFLLSLVNKERLRRLLTRMLSEDEFLSDHGIRSLSRAYKDEPYELTFAGETHVVEYEPSESRTGMFGGNSNWRGPVWFPPNYLLIEALQVFDFYYGEDLKVEFPTGSGNEMTLWQVSQELEKRLGGLFLKNADGKRAVNGSVEKFQTDEHFRDLILFYEYFNGDNGEGLGANHQTGWTGLIAKILKQVGEYSENDIV